MQEVSVNNPVKFPIKILNCCWASSKKLQGATIFAPLCTVWSTDPAVWIANLGTKWQQTQVDVLYRPHDHNGNVDVCMSWFNVAGVLGWASWSRQTAFDVTVDGLVFSRL